MLSRATQVFAAHHVLHDTDEHAESGQSKAVVPVDVLPDPSADQGREERAEIDPHVEDGEACVAALIAWRVNETYDRADVRFQQSCAEDDENQAGVKGRSAAGQEAEGFLPRLRCDRVHALIRTRGQSKYCTRYVAQGGSWT